MNYYAVIDTNVLVSALLKIGSVPGKVAAEALRYGLRPVSMQGRPLCVKMSQRKQGYTKAPDKVYQVRYTLYQRCLCGSGQIMRPIGS